ncbi:dTDP-4-dehydrorhamnose reductase [Cognatishimia sp.]|uniref:dTDP-4-dehydrorhamnose reductase n=1 Tax=Cognatishimia sp. TaxID=2211648 RepID=UPI0035131BCE
MKLLVFGKTGQVAQELIQQAGAHDIQCLERNIADLSDPAACAALIASSDADAVINAAAYTAVDKAEDDEALATIINAEAPGAMARACAAKDIPFLHISTDYVFDGAWDFPRQPSDPVGPINAYGRSKLAGEEAVRAAGGRHVILRTSWVFSAHGSNFVKTMLRLSESREMLSVVADQVGGPTSARDIAGALLAIAPQLAGTQSGGTYHFSGQPNASWADFARAIFEISGANTQVTDIATKDYPTPAQRPLNSRLDCSAISRDFDIKVPDWRASLAEVLQTLRG